jgi:hypothetical protein
LKSVMLARDQPSFLPGEFPGLTGQHRSRLLEKSGGNVAPSGVFIALCYMRRSGPRDAACREGWVSTTFTLRMLAFNGFNRPVLKHGPRSLTCLRVFGWKTLVHNESES